MKKGLHKFKKVCYDNPRWETSIAIWACSSVGSAKGSVFCHIYNFILFYSSVPLLELLIWARSSVWERKGFGFLPHL